MLAYCNFMIKCDLTLSVLPVCSCTAIIVDACMAPLCVRVCVCVFERGLGVKSFQTAAGGYVFSI